MSEERKEPPRGEKAARWWRSLNGLGDKPETDPGALARLRRETSPARAWGEPAVARLYRDLGFGQEDRDWRMESVALLAMVLSHVREETGGTLGSALGASSDGAPAVMNPLRVRRLTAARDGAETLRGFREAVALLGGKAPVTDLAGCVLDWTDARRGDRTRSRFLFAYHGAAFAAPHDDDAAPRESDDAPPISDTKGPTP